MLYACLTANVVTKVNNITYIFNAPFLAVFKKTQVIGSIIEWSTLLAMLVYWIIAMGIIKFFIMSKTVSTSEAAAKMDKKEDLQ
jgi:hypothetical protein